MVESGQKYRHYKGGAYVVVGIAMHTETSEEMVVYKSENGSLYARPALIFSGKVGVNGIRVRRFSLEDSYDNSEICVTPKGQMFFMDDLARTE